jgi:hypothetical protein
MAPLCQAADAIFEDFLFEEILTEVLVPAGAVAGLVLGCAG